MSLYDDVVTDFGTTNKSEVQSDIANWSSNSFKLLQLQVEAAKKRQLQLSSAANLKREKASTNIAPVIDLSDKRKPQLQLKKDLDSHHSPTSSSSLAATIAVAVSAANSLNPHSLKNMPPTPDLVTSSSSSSSYYSSSELRFNTLTGKIEREDITKSIYANSNEEYDPMRPNDYEKLLEDKRKLSRLNRDSNGSSKVDDDRRERDRDRRRKRSDRRKGSDSDDSRDRDRDKDRERDRDRERGGDRDRDRDRRRSSRDRNRDRDHDSKSSSKRRSRHTSSSDEDTDGDRRKRKHRETSASSSTNNNKRSDDSKRQSAAFAPPPSLIEQDNKPTNNESADESKQAKKSLYGGLLKAEKMMAKMGYREGEGLGRNKQGMSIALQVEKTGKRSGRIIHEKDVIAEQVAAAAAAASAAVAALPLPVTPITATTTLTAPTATTTLPGPPKEPAAPIVGVSNEVMKNMSKVILLRNMVAPGDVDDDLEVETKEECQKYGEVNRCIIFEMPNKPPEEAVRIFIEFKTLPSAIKALTDLNGRFFAGRTVKATFYNLDKFNRLELADEL